MIQGNASIEAGRGVATGGSGGGLTEAQVLTLISNNASGITQEYANSTYLKIADADDQ